jgi:tRNA (cytidine/uridine-2'-O-)-methyltransferase
MIQPPAPVLHVVLVEPQIPPNTGNIARLCAATRCHLILVGALGFALDAASLRRAGLDYWEAVSWEHLPDWETLAARMPPRSFHLLTTRAQRPYTHMPVAPADYLVFGKETAGLPASLLEAYPDQCYTIPMQEPRVRSLNLSSAVALVLYAALSRVAPFAHPPPGAPRD